MNRIAATPNDRRSGVGRHESPSRWKIAPAGRPGLGKQFRKRPVLRDVSLTVQRGEVVGLLGPNGAGKTTCFYIITGLIKADQGAIVLDGIDVTAMPMYRRARLGIGYLPQEASIFRGLSVDENIRAVLEIVEPDRATQREARLDELLSEFSIAHLQGGAGGRAVGRRAAARRDRPRAGVRSQLHPAGRALRRHRSHRRRRHPRSLVASEGSRHRRAHHRSQCPRDAGYRRSRLHPP